MKSWIKYGAVCEVHGHHGILFRIRCIIPQKLEGIQLEPLDTEMSISNAQKARLWVSHKNLMRTERCRQAEKKMAISGEKYQGAMEMNLKKARELVERYGYVVVRKMP
jgi:hypothetical protein